ncbi:MAG: 2-oxoglutarate dehydrogenase E1 component [Gammaproteobacteria bacterium]|nr:2-oxoglutarate dehydrogenase E1 component [Gammaproteobacteria bacterium]
MSDSLRALLDSTPLGASNAAYVESLYEQYLLDPDTVEPRWREYFDSLGAAPRTETPHTPLREALAERARARTTAVATASASTVPDVSAKQGGVARLAQVYANRGHLLANIDPLGLMKRPVPEVLELRHFGLSEADLDTEFYTGSRIDALPQRMKLRDFVALLRQVWCGTIGAEFAHVSNSTERLWLQSRFLEGRLRHRFSTEERKSILWHLTAAEGLELYFATKYPAQKRFSLEGGDSLIPMLDDLIQQGGKAGVEEIVIGMAHRGRLNVLVNVVGKPPQEIVSEFEGHYDSNHLQGSGDVKYHKGFSSDIRTPGGNVHVALAFNPSHLEVVNPVVQGSVRARQQRRRDTKGDKVVPVLIHGDAAFAGQGVVMETLQLSQARGFYTGGTIHIIINNQIGFTTSDPRDSRSTLYCSDVAKMIEAPIFHVNGDDPEALLFATRLALEYRMKFHKDVVIDLVCYRRRGHNEADEPAATQPVMYRRIREHPTPRQLYAQKLIAEGLVTQGEVDAMVENYRRDLDEGKTIVRHSLGMIGNKHTVDWTKFRLTERTRVDTRVRIELLRELGTKLTTLPPNFKLHRQVENVIQARRKMTAGQLPLDWGFAETLAYATLLTEGFQVRIVGQDSGRGTFFHRHAVLHHQETGETYVPLEHVAPSQPQFTVIDSLLSEEAVLGFEYGFSTTEPNCLAIWEAQFGDFANGAQVIIDQFISSGEAKWGRLCGLTLFLPHGYEGQGPEHSSARLERFLQLCAELNMQVCVPSTPAQMFHMLRRQVKQPFRKPLIVMTPKSLLRHKLSVSSLEDLADGEFQHVIDEIDDLQPENVTRVVFCSGKVYFDLLESRRSDGVRNVAIVRIEQLYPFPTEEYAAVVRKYPNAREIVWCQEEPQNQGGWYQIRHRLQEPLTSDQQLLYAGRAPAAAPATGIYQMHVEQQIELVDAALRSTSTEESLRHTTRLKAAGKSN